MDTLCDDELEAIGYALADPLAPDLAVALSSACRVLRRALEAPLKELKERHEEVEELCEFVGGSWSCERLRTSTSLIWYHGGVSSRSSLNAAHVETLGMLLATNGMSPLQELQLGRNSIGDESVRALVGGLGRRALPALKGLWLQGNEIGSAGAAALAAALSLGAMPSLARLHLGSNMLGDQGAAALASVSPSLTTLGLSSNQIGDDGVASLLANKKLCESLERLYLGDNQITEAGCAALVAALDRGALPAVRSLSVEANPASPAALQAVSKAVLSCFFKDW